MNKGITIVKCFGCIEILEILLCSSVQQHLRVDTAFLFLLKKKQRQHRDANPVCNNLTRSTFLKLGIF